jgi:hypothetical protein
MMTALQYEAKADAALEAAARAADPEIKAHYEDIARDYLTFAALAKSQAKNRGEA